MSETNQAKRSGGTEKNAAGPLEFSTTEQPREGAGRAILHVLVGTLIFAGCTAVYLWDANRTHRAQTLVLDARPLAELADVVSLRRAVTKYEQALAEKSGFEKAVAGLAEAYTLLWVDHGLEDYRDKAKSAIRLAAADNIERGERYGAEALVAYTEGRLDDAVRISQGVLDKGGVSERLYYALGLALRAKGDLKKGRDNLRRAQDLRSGAPHYAVKLANAYDEDGNRHNAAHFWAIANTANSNYVPAVAGHIIGRARKGFAPKALFDELERLSELPAEDLGKEDLAMIALARAEVLYQRARTAEAAKAANQAITIAGENAPRLFARGLALIADGKLDRGFRDLTAARALVPGSSRYFYETARQYHRRGRHDAALGVLKDPARASEHAHEPEYHTLLADILRDKGEPDKALAAYDEALKLNGEHPEAFLGKGVAHWRKKDYSGSLKWFEKAVVVRPQFPEVYEAIGLMWFEQRAGEHANTQLEEAERQLNKGNANRIRMGEFYAAVLKGLTSNRASSSHIKQWVAKEEAFRAAGKSKKKRASR